MKLDNLQWLQNNNYFEEPITGSPSMLASVRHITGSCKSCIRTEKIGGDKIPDTNTYIQYDEAETNVCDLFCLDWFNRT